MAKTNAQKQRAMRQEELRNLLVNKGLIQKVIEDVGKIDELAELKVKDYNKVEEYLAELSTAKDKASIIKIAVDSRLKLINKYLPDVKSIELTGDEENPVQIAGVVFKGVSNKD